MVTTVGLKLDDESRERLKSLGEAKDRSSHWLMKSAIAEYRDREERYEREKREDEARWQAYVDTGECVSQEEMILWFDELTRQAHEAQIRTGQEDEDI